MLCPYQYVVPETEIPIPLPLGTVEIPGEGGGKPKKIFIWQGDGGWGGNGYFLETHVIQPGAMSTPHSESFI